MQIKCIYNHICSFDHVKTQHASTEFRRNLQSVSRRSLGPCLLPKESGYSTCFRLVSWCASRIGAAELATIGGMESGGGNERWNSVPVWDGRPESFQHFIHEVRWTLSSSKAEDKALLAAKIIRKGLQSGQPTLVQLLYKLDPDEFRTEADVQKLITFLEKSPLNRQAKQDRKLL